jgi:hypothetical protein
MTQHPSAMYVYRRVIRPRTPTSNPRHTPVVGYQVQILRYGVTKFFNVRKWGGEQRAFRAAVEWRDDMLKILERTHGHG